MASNSPHTVYICNVCCEEHDDHFDAAICCPDVTTKYVCVICNEHYDKYSKAVACTHTSLCHPSSNGNIRCPKCGKDNLDSDGTCRFCATSMVPDRKWWELEVVSA